MATCHRLISQTCALGKALSCWFTVASILKVVYRTVDLHTLSSCSLLSQLFILLLEWTLQVFHLSMLRSAEAICFFQSPGFESELRTSKNPTRDWGVGKDTHFCSQRGAVTHMERSPFSADWCRCTTGSSLCL